MNLADITVNVKQMHTSVAYKKILKVADPPLIYKSVKELKALVSKGFPVTGGKTLVLVNDKGQVCERIYILGCLDIIEIDKGYLEYLSDNYIKSRGALLHISKRFEYGETKCCMVYDTYKREDGWFVVPLYQLTSDHKTADFKINFRGFKSGCKSQVAGFEFQPLEEKVSRKIRMELHDQGLEEYRDIVKAASQSLFYKSLEELEVLLSVGVYLNGYKTWLSRNENGEHCEMLSISNCLISREGGYDFSYNDLYSRFPRFLETNRKEFKVHIITQFLTPSIRYTVNLVLRKEDSSQKQMYVGLRYKLEGETETSIVYLANETKDNRSFIAELYQFTSNGRTFELDIVFEDHRDDLEVEGILFQPLEIVEHDQVLEDEELSNDRLQWTLKKDLFSYLLKRFNGQEGYVDNNGKKSVMFSARGVIQNWNLSFESSPESRFGEVAVITSYKIEIEKKIKSDVVSPETRLTLQQIDNLSQNRMENAIRIIQHGKNKESKDWKEDFGWFNCDTPIGKSLMNFSMELEKDNANQGIQDYIGEYGVMIDDKDLEYMTDYLFSDNGPSFMNDLDEDLEKEGGKLIGTPSERISKPNQELDEWAKENGYISLGENEVVGKVTHVM
nr:protein kinase-like domain, phloem protein 2-like protein [Tanacetum cinerariifolium]